MRYKLHKTQSYPKLRMTGTGLPLEEQVLRGIRNQVPALDTAAPIQSDFAVANSSYLLSRIVAEDFPTLGRYVGAIMGLFGGSEYCSVGVVPKNSSRIASVPRLEHRLTVRMEGDFLAMDEGSAWDNELLKGMMEASFRSKKAMFIDRMLAARIVYDDLDPHNNGCEICPLAKGEPGRNEGALALMPFYYREQADPCGIVAFAGDLRCRDSAIEGFSRIFWSARLAMAAASQISDKLAHKFDAITILTKYEDFEVDLKNGIRQIVEKEAKNTYLILIDVDDFKKVNDKYGYEAGNDVLREVAEKIKASVRTGDLVSRWGGEEFAVILKDVSGREEANHIAERIRTNIEQNSVVCSGGRRVNVTCSIGVSFVDGIALGFELVRLPQKRTDSDTIKAIQKRVFDMSNSALRYAKETGKNRVCFAEIAQTAPTI
jgi:diguanylate cyclase (GGDEF)-like protein